MSRILYVLDYLSRNTDAEKGATLKDIQAYLLNQTNAGSVVYTEHSAGYRPDRRHGVYGGHPEGGAQHVLLSYA